MRRRRQNPLHTPVVLAVVALTYPTEAHAYLDAGTVNMLLQAAAAALAGSLFLLKQYWRQVKAFFARSAPPDAAASPAAPDAEDPKAR